MKYISFFTLIFLFILNGFSQPPLNIAENFDDNSLLWEVGSSDVYDCEISNGMYSINHRPTDNSGRFYSRGFKVDDSKDYIIETKIRFVSGADNHAYGLFWGADGWVNSNRFNISGNRFYRLYHYEGENLLEDVKWTLDTNIIKSNSEFNILRVQKEGDFVHISINNSKVAKLSARNFKGNEIGFFIGEKMKIEVDYLHIYQYGDAKINLVKNPINGYKKQNLGTAINGKFSDRAPIISSDGKTLYFIKGGYPELQNKGTEVYVSQQLDNGEWGESQNFGSPINNSGSNMVINVSADGNTVHLMNKYNEDGTIKSKGLSISQKTEKGWEIPKEVVIEDYYNDSKYVGFSFSSNKKVLIMSVNRKDTYGKEDLYVSFQKEDGTYSIPLNMGSTLNTLEDESTPFLAPDDRTLYFSSDGHIGYGQLDIFVTRRLDDTWTNWSVPENLGPEINSNQFDASFTVTGKGDYAYLVSADNSFGIEDIFKIKIPDAAKPTPLILIKGKVLNSKTKEPIFGEIIYQDLNTGKEVGKALSDPITGNYQVVLPAGIVYGYLAEKKGFYPVSNFADATNITEYKELNVDLLLTPIEIGENIRLNNLFFETNKSDLKNISISELDRLVQFLKENPAIIIEIGGHTDNVGAPAYNQTLSEKRAQSVMTYLVSKEIDAKRLSAKGFGLTKPVAPNTDEDGKAMNRRVEMKILAK